MNLLRNDIDTLVEVKDEIGKLKATEDTKLEKLENQNIFYRSLFLNKKFPTKRYRYFSVTNTNENIDNEKENLGLFPIVLCCL